MNSHPPLDFLCEAEVSVGPPLTVGQGPGGLRRIIPILGGQVRGPGMSGEIMPGGADHQIIRPDGVVELVARYTIRLDGGALVYVVNSGIRDAAPEDAARLLRGEPVPPERVYFRTAPVFETASPEHAWLHRRLFVAYGERAPDTVRLRFFAI